MTLSGSMPRTVLVLASSLLFLAHFLLILVPRAPLEEDAFITCRFAENVAAGKGFVFNEGERVEGFSNPSLVVMLAAAVTAGLPAPQTAQAIGLLSVILLFVYLGASAGAERSPSDRLARLAAMPLVATCFPFVFWAHQGLETALFATLLTVASLELMRATPIGHWLGGWLFALAIWTRPEAPLVALAATAAVWLRERSWRSFLAAFSPVLVALAALAVWRLAYFGDLLPNTYYAKPPRGLGRSLNFLYDFFRLTHLWYFVPALAIAFVAVRKREDRELLIPLAVVAAQVFFIIYEGGDKKPNHRFLVPILPLCFYLAARAVASLAGRRQTLAVAGATLVFVAVNLLCRVQPPAGGPSMPALAVAARELRPRLWRSWLSERLRTFEPGYIPGNIHTEIGLWVKRTVPPGSTIAYDQMGQTPYFSGHSYKYIDLYGLTDATVAHLKHRFGTEIVPELADYLESRAPAFILVHMNMKIPLVDHPHQRGESCKLCAFLAKYEDIGAMTDLAGNRLGSALRRKPGA